MFERVRDIFRSAATARHLTRGVKAYKEGRLADAREAVDRALAPGPGIVASQSLRTHQLTVRMLAVALRAEVAAKQGDGDAANASIHEGFALWEQARRGHVGLPSIEAFAEWETWARGYLAAQQR